MEHEAQTRVERPVSTVYNQWTQFESFPEFMQGVNKVIQLDDESTQWDVEIAGVKRAFTADTDDVPSPGGLDSATDCRPAGLTINWTVRPSGSRSPAGRT